MPTVTAANVSGARSAAFALTVNEPSGWLINPANYAQVITGQTFSGDVNLTGVSNRLYVQCTFQGGMLKLESCSHVAFLCCQRRGGAGTDRGLRLSDQGRCHDIIWEGGVIEDVPYDGISVAGDCLANGEPFHTGVVIRKTLVRRIALATGLGSGLRHGIYAWGPVLIEASVFNDCPAGNCISLRGGGYVKGCWLRGAGESGAAYYCDHPEGIYPGLGKVWRIEDTVACNINRDGNASDWCFYAKNMFNTANLVERLEVVNCKGDRASPARFHSSYPASVVKTSTGNQTLTTAQCNALFPTNYPLLAA